MSLDAEQREALRLELLARANERDKWINDHYRGLDLCLERLRAQVRDCNSYTDIHESHRQRITAQMWAERKVERKIYNDGSLVRHELNIRAWSGEHASRLLEAEDATARIEARIRVKPPFVREWHVERDLLRSLARDVEMGRLGCATVAQVEERCENGQG